MYFAHFERILEIMIFQPGQAKPDLSRKRLMSVRCSPYLSTAVLLSSNSSQTALKYKSIKSTERL